MGVFRSGVALAPHRCIPLLPKLTQTDNTVLTPLTKMGIISPSGDSREERMAESDLIVVTLKLSPEQVALVDRCKALLQEANPGPVITRSDVLRAAVERTFRPLDGASIEEIKAQLEGVAA
jgi:hypothetical protein